MAAHTERPIPHSVFTMQRNTHDVPRGKWQQLAQAQHHGSAHHTTNHHQEHTAHAAIPHEPAHPTPFPTHPTPQEHAHPVEHQPGGTRVEQLTAADLPAFRSLMIHNLETFPYLPAHTKQEQIARRTPEYYEHVLADPNQTLLVAKDAQGNVIGGIEAEFTSQQATEPTAYVKWIVVSEQNRQHGVGRSLYEEYERRARARGGIKYLMAHVHNDNMGSLRLHQRVGLTTVYRENNNNTGKYYVKDIRGQAQASAHPLPHAA